MMTQAQLIETIEAYRKGETCLNGLLADVDTYSAASNSAKLSVLSCREFFEQILINETQFVGDKNLEFAERKEHAKNIYHLDFVIKLIDELPAL